MTARDMVWQQWPLRGGVNVLVLNHCQVCGLPHIYRLRAHWMNGRWKVGSMCLGTKIPTQSLRKQQYPGASWGFRSLVISLYLFFDGESFISIFCLPSLCGISESVSVSVWKPRHIHVFLLSNPYTRAPAFLLREREHLRTYLPFSMLGPGLRERERERKRC